MENAGILQSRARPFKLDEFPEFSPERIDINDNRIVGFDSRDRRSRAFNLLRSSLAKRLSEQGCRLVGITSATPDAGKSFLSMNLAASLSRVMDDPVFLVDLDLRRGTLAEQVGLETESGITGYLNGEIEDLASIGRRIAGADLVVFPTARATGNSAEMVSGGVFDAFIDRMRTSTGNSVVIFDLPPAFASDDTMLIVQKLDGYLMVADSGVTTKRQVREVIRLLEPSPCVGTILNRYRGGVADMYGYGYGSYGYSKYYD